MKFLRMLRTGWMVVLLVLVLEGCQKKTGMSSQPEIAVANSYLEAVVRDLGVDSSRIMSVVPPGMCPGHFDLTPSQANRLVSCSVLLVFDFQNQIASSLPRSRQERLKVSVITPPPGLCMPDSYLSVVRQVTAGLTSIDANLAPDAVGRLPLIEERIRSLKQTIQNQIDTAGLRNASVLVSKHQEIFARWLGVNPVGTFRGSDAETPGTIQSALQSAAKQPVRWVIANRQEGTDLAQSLAKRLSVPLVVFGNFPEAIGDRGDQPAFDSLVGDNVRRLVEASR